MAAAIRTHEMDAIGRGVNATRVPVDRPERVARAVVAIEAAHGVLLSQRGPRTGILGGWSEHHENEAAVPGGDGVRYWRSRLIGTRLGSEHQDSQHREQKAGHSAHRDA